jgi:S-ribosylhomocysteine lyase
MDTIPSFTVDHNTLMPGLYISRRDLNNTLTTFDLRFKQPNKEPAIDTAALHAIEHLGATFLRNHANWRDRVIYFGPMGCRTGFYLILNVSDVKGVLHLVRDMTKWIANYTGAIPGGTAKECGNYLDLNLEMANGRQHGIMPSSTTSRIAHPSHTWVNLQTWHSPLEP